MNTKKILKELNALPPVFRTAADMTRLLHELAGKPLPPDLERKAAVAPPMRSAQYKPADLPGLVSKAKDPARRHLVRKEELEVLRRNGVAV